MKSEKMKSILKTESKPYLNYRIHTCNSKIVQIGVEKILPCCRARYFGAAKALADGKKCVTGLASKRFLAVIQNLLEAVSQTCICKEGYYIRNCLRLRMKEDGRVASMMEESEFWYREVSMVLTVLTDLILTGLRSRTRTVDNIWSQVQGHDRYRINTQKRQLLSNLNEVKNNIKTENGAECALWLELLKSITNWQTKLQRLMPSIFLNGEILPAVLNSKMRPRPNKRGDRHLDGLRETKVDMWFCTDCKTAKDYIGQV